MPSKKTYRKYGKKAAPRRYQKSKATRSSPKPRGLSNGQARAYGAAIQARQEAKALAAAEAVIDDEEE